MDDDDVEWADPDDQMGLWEYQLTPLSARELLLALGQVAPEPAVEVEHCDGTGDVHLLRAMHIDVRNRGGQRSSVVITVHESAPSRTSLERS